MVTVASVKHTACCVVKIIVIIAGFLNSSEERDVYNKGKQVLFF